MRALLFTLLAVTACGSSAQAPDARRDVDAAKVVDASAASDAAIDAPAALPEPVLFIHGINGSAANWDALKARLVAAGWPADRLFARTFPDPSWGCNVDNAALIATWIAEIRLTTGATRVDVVAHSMGALSSRHFMKHGGGATGVGTYVTLGGMHHGKWEPCLSPLDVCVWKEICSTGAFVTEINTAPAIPGPAHYVSIYSKDDGTVPVDSAHLDGAENIEVTGLSHDGLLDDPGVAAEVARVLAYP